MDTVPRLLSRFAVVLIIAASTWSPVRAVESHPGCPPGQAPSFSLGFAELQSHIGPAMGDPVECERTDPASGDSHQRTSTGIALYRRDTNTPMFTNGQEHWALTAGGIARWSGWHGSAAPAGVAASRQSRSAEESTSPVGTYPSVEAVTIVDVHDDGRRLVVSRGAHHYLIETDGGCDVDLRPVGEVVFVVSPAAFAGPQARLIPMPGGRECLITAGQPV